MMKIDKIHVYYRAMKRLCVCVCVCVCVHVCKPNYLTTSAFPMYTLEWKFVKRQTVLTSRWCYSC